MILNLFNEDCMAVMSRYPAGYFDLAIVDPPYGIGEDGSKNKSRGKCATAKDYVSFAGNDNEPPSPEYFAELFRVSKNQIVFGANHFISRLPVDSPCWIVWDKNNGENDFADCELAWTSFKTAVRRYSYTWNGMLQQDMKNKEIRIHPTQKPVQLYKWLLSKYAEPGQRILDTHLGSASSAIAAHYFGAGEFVGTELHPHYFNEAVQRFNQQTRQLTLL